MQTCRGRPAPHDGAQDGVNLQVVFDVVDPEGLQFPMLGQLGHCLSAGNELSLSLR